MGIGCCFLYVDCHILGRLFLQVEMVIKRIRHIKVGSDQIYNYNHFLSHRELVRVFRNTLIIITTRKSQEKNPSSVYPHVFKSRIAINSLYFISAY